MKNKLLVVLAVAGGLLMVSRSMFAHHGVARFDMRRTAAVMGIVTQYDFINPHIHIYFDVKNDNGTVDKWDAEGSSPNMMRRNGWTSHTVKPGDQITATGRPAKDGSPSMRLDKLVLPNGQEIIPWNN